ncbi:MAG: hypothetical protein ABL866_11705 [Devosia sp.]
MLAIVYDRLLLGLWPFGWRRLTLGPPPRLIVIFLLAVLSWGLVIAIVVGIVIGVRALLGW